MNHSRAEVLVLGAKTETMRWHKPVLSERAIFLSQEPQFKPYLDISRMAEITQSMVKNVLDSFLTQDSNLARSVCDKDDIVDGLNSQVFRELLTFMISDPQTITRAVRLIIVCRCLERIADHATSIAEDVIFLLDARVIKHHADVKEEGEGRKMS